MSVVAKLVGEDFTLVRDGNRFYRTLEHNSLVIDTRKDLFYWNSKHISGNAIDYLVRVRHMSVSKAKQYITAAFASLDVSPVTVEITDEEDNSFVVDSSLVQLFYLAGKNNSEYWKTVRGYTQRTIDDFKLGFTGEWYTLPIYEDGKFVNFQVRKENPKRIKHWYKGVGPHSFNFSLLNIYEWVVIAEGPADAIMLRQNDIPGVSQSGGSSHWNKDWNRFFVGKKIYIVYDNDDAGKLSARKLGEMFGKVAIVYTFSDFPEKYDITDYFKAGNTREDFINLLERNGKYGYEI